MNDVIQDYFANRALCETHGDAVATSLNTSAHTGPPGFFGMAFNNLTMTLELLTHYYELWGKITGIQNVSADQAREENGQRVVMIQKMSFVENLSALEFTAKNIVLSETTRFGAFPGRIYLSTVMKRSLDRGLIDNAEHERWTGLIRLRNCLVHHNGIAEETTDYVYPDVTLHVTAGSMTQGDLRLFGKLTKWMLNASADWIGKACTPNP